MPNSGLVNKVIVGSDTLIDLTGDTVTPETLASGKTAHDKSGARITGIMEGGGNNQPFKMGIPYINQAELQKILPDEGYSGLDIVYIPPVAYPDDIVIRPSLEDNTSTVYTSMAASFIDSETGMNIQPVDCGVTIRVQGYRSKLYKNTSASKIITSGTRYTLSQLFNGNGANGFDPDSSIQLSCEGVVTDIYEAVGNDLKSKDVYVIGRSYFDLPGLPNIISNSRRYKMPTSSNLLNFKLSNQRMSGRSSKPDNSNSDVPKAYNNRMGSYPLISHGGTLLIPFGNKSSPNGSEAIVKIVKNSSLPDCHYLYNSNQFSSNSANIEQGLGNITPYGYITPNIPIGGLVIERALPTVPRTIVNYRFDSSDSGNVLTALSDWDHVNAEDDPRYSYIEIGMGNDRVLKFVTKGGSGNKTFYLYGAKIANEGTNNQCLQWVENTTAFVTASKTGSDIYLAYFALSRFSFIIVYREFFNNQTLIYGAAKMQRVDVNPSTGNITKSTALTIASAETSTNDFNYAIMPALYSRSSFMVLQESRVKSTGVSTYSYNTYLAKMDTAGDLAARESNSAFVSLGNDSTYYFSIPTCKDWFSFDDMDRFACIKRVNINTKSTYAIYTLAHMGPAVKATELYHPYINNVYPYQDTYEVNAFDSLTGSGAMRTSYIVGTNSSNSNNAEQNSSIAIIEFYCPALKHFVSSVREYQLDASANTSYDEYALYFYTLQNDFLVANPPRDTSGVDICGIEAAYGMLCKVGLEYGTGGYGAPFRIHYED